MLRNLFLKITSIFNDNTRNEESLFNLLPKEIFFHIISYLEMKELPVAVQVNKQFHDDIYSYTLKLKEQKEATTYKLLLNEFNEYRRIKDEIKILKTEISKFNQEWKIRCESYREYEIRDYYCEIIRDILFTFNMLISMGASAYIGVIFYHIYDGLFVAIENGLLAAVASFFIESVFVYPRCHDIARPIAEKITNFKMKYQHEKEEKLKQVETPLNLLPHPKLLSLK